MSTPGHGDTILGLKRLRLLALGALSIESVIASEANAGSAARQTHHLWPIYCLYCGVYPDINMVWLL
jgi:hypothetical protein